MATITLDQDAPGKAGSSPLFGSGARKIVTGQFTFDSSYPTGGEDISDIFTNFRELKGMWMEHPVLSAGTGKRVQIDYTAKKAKLLDNAVATAEVANASDQSGAAGLHFIAWGL